MEQYKIGVTSISAKYIQRADSAEAFIAQCNKDEVLLKHPDREKVLAALWTEVCGSAVKEEPAKVVEEPAKQDKPKPNGKK